jgi:lipopolysaccharide export system protein LptC
MSQAEGYDRRGFMATGRADSARVFRAAMRHSRVVRLLRVAIPVGAVLGVVGIFLAATVLDPLRALARLPVKIEGLVVSGTKITTRGARYEGYTRDRRPYVVTAHAASHDVTKPDTFELTDLRAKMEMKDAGGVEMTAEAGLFEIKADRLTLQKNVLINSQTYKARMTEAVVNIRTSHVVSDKPVEVIMQQATINANRLEVTNSGEVIRFEGGVTVLLTPEKSGEKAGTR